MLLQLVVQAEPDGIVRIGRESSASDFPVGELWVVNQKGRNRWMKSKMIGFDEVDWTEGRLEQEAQ